MRIFGFRFRGAPGWFCQVPLCGVHLGNRPRRWEFCPSCRLAFGRGAVVAALAGVAWRILETLFSS